MINLPKIGDAISIFGSWSKYKQTMKTNWNWKNVQFWNNFFKVMIKIVFNEIVYYIFYRKLDKINIWNMKPQKASCNTSFMKLCFVCVVFYFKDDLSLIKSCVVKFPRQRNYYM